MSEHGGNVRVAAMSGLLIGSVMGFVDTYGYAVTGYTTSELSPIIASTLSLALLRALLRRAPSVLEHLISIVIASGISLSSAITSGMYITYTMLKEVSGPEAIGLPNWLYFSNTLLPTLPTMSFYLFATAVSVSGTIIAYILSKHFIEKERLPYPIGLAASLLIRIGRVLSKPKITLPLLLGVVIQLLLMWIGGLTLDLTSLLQTVLPGSSIAITLDLFVLVLAMLIPLNTTIGVGIGNLVMYLLITPVMVYLNLMYVLPSMSSSDITIAAAPLTASVIVGFVIIATIYYFVSVRSALFMTIRVLMKSRDLLKQLVIALILMSMAIVPLLMLWKMPKSLIAVMPGYMLLQLLITILTIRVVGEVGTASQSTLPPATFVLFISGARGALPYVFLDPYTGTPMPQFIAGSSMNLIKTSESLNISSKLTSSLLMLSLLIGAPITLIYGHALLLAFGISSPKFNLLRWVPVVTWMTMVYKGDLASFSFIAIIIGALVPISLLLLFRLLGVGGISLYSILLGMTLTPDVGILFLIASIVKYVALRIGVDVYESLITYSALVLAGAGIGVALSAVLSLWGVM